MNKNFSFSRLFLGGLAIVILALPLYFAQAGSIIPPPPPSPPSSTHLLNPLGGTTSFSDLVSNVAGIAARIGFMLAVVYIIYAGLMFVVARGKPAELEKAKKNLLYVVLGTGILLGAWVIAKVIFATIQQLGS